jgi:hypothetical protein
MPSSTHYTIGDSPTLYYLLLQYVQLADCIFTHPDQVFNLILSSALGLAGQM